MALFTDWDGTVTLQDCNDLLTDDLGMGKNSRLVLNNEIFNNETSFRIAFDKMLKSVSNNNHSIYDCINYLKNHIKLDPGFKPTVEYCYQNNIPVIIVSSGMSLVIKELLQLLLPDDNLRNYIQIIANDVKINDNDGTWEIKYRDDTSFGHDKNQSIINIINNWNDSRRPLIYSGDGVSDISAARSCDILLAKKGCDLISICQRDNVKYREFKDFNEILEIIKSTI
ncbi:putative phosphoric monoester hydrolase [Pichia kluyveri]|uniref:Phosphoric monoester hydrolase n=1 Tax=Pichia kluyveri TaxID=36015 RepID=A0AAV5R1B0_PICKL|nr:putative phosphoric monoester hydrolase [Pichia kluyveri]